MHCIAGKYEVITELGTGGTGVVYLVRHTDLGVSYALKVLNRELSEDEHFIESFKREAEVLLRFSHPGTTQLRDFGRTEDGHYYFAMDYCDGVSLKEILDRDGPYPIKRALNITLEILDVLRAAHEQGIVHRDIKPANTMIREQEDGLEIVQVLDFGTALIKKQLESDESHAVVGTPCYMSPEQASGERDLDSRSDLYSVGILLYELLTGDVPFEGETVVQTLLMQVTQPPAPFAALYGIPEEVEQLVLKALEKSPEKRFQSAIQFTKACKEVLKSAEQWGRAKRVEAKEETAVASPSTEQSGAAPEELRILCLDDNEMILHILQHILEREGYTVFTAIDCSSIHNYLFNEQIDLLISDINMPGMPGTKICKMLKSEMDELKIILFSNIADRDLKKQSQESNADGWISKNTKPEEWLTEIKRIIKQQNESAPS